MYRKRQPEPLPYHRNFRLRLPADQGHLVVATTSRMVSVIRIRTPHGQPDYTIRWLVSDVPALAALYDNLWGWNLVGLIGFIEREIDMATFDLRQGEAREWLDDINTVSIPSLRPKRQHKRPVEQTIPLIREFVMSNPWCTRLDIARFLGRSKSPYLVAQIEWMVNKGILGRSQNIRPNGFIEFRYIVVDDE